MKKEGRGKLPTAGVGDEEVKVQSVFRRRIHIDDLLHGPLICAGCIWGQPGTIIEQGKAGVNRSGAKAGDCELLRTSGSSNHRPRLITTVSRTHGSQRVLPTRAWAPLRKCGRFTGAGALDQGMLG